jgi:hypothetical protein
MGKVCNVKLVAIYGIATVRSHIILICEHKGLQKKIAALIYHSSCTLVYICCNC